jgi:hypothetical protein
MNGPRRAALAIFGCSLIFAAAAATSGSCSCGPRVPEVEYPDGGSEKKGPSLGARLTREEEHGRDLDERIDRQEKKLDQVIGAINELAKRQQEQRR